MCVSFLRASKNKTTLKNANAMRPTERPIDIESTDARPQMNARLPSHTQSHTSTHTHTHISQNDSDKQRRVHFI